MHFGPGGILLSGGSERDVAPATLIGRAALAGLLAAGTLLVVAAARTPSLLPASIAEVPGQFSGPLGSAGFDLGVGGVIAVLLLMLGCYVLVVRCARRIGVRGVLAAIVALHALVLLGPPLISTDVFSYLAYARMGAHYGINPYLHGPVSIRFDAVFPLIGADWYATPSVYGPLFTAGSYLLAPLAAPAGVLADRTLTAAASLGLVALVWHCARRRSLDPTTAVALVGLNPLLVVDGVGGGHNDLLMLLALGGSVSLLLARRGAAGGALSILALGLKLTGGLVLPFALADGGARRGLSARRGLLLGCLVALALLAGLSTLLFGTAPLHLLSTLRRAQAHGGWLSIAGALRHDLGLPALARLIGDGLLAAGLLAGIGLLVAVWRGALDWIDGAAWATLVLLCVSPALQPWYVAWLLPLAALARDARLRSAALTLTAVVLAAALLGTIPHG